MAFTTETDSNYGSAPYAEAAQQARFRLGLRDRLLAGLAGLGSVQPGMNFGQSFIAGLGGSARATWAAQQAAMNYAQRQADQELERQKNEIYRMQTEASIKAPAPKEEKPVPKDINNMTEEEWAQYIKRTSEEAKAKAAGKPVPMAKGPAAPKVAAVKPPKPPSAAEKSNAGVLSAASKAETSLRAQEDKIGNDILSQARLKLPNAVQTAAEQQYVQAQNWWIENVLRQVSGAAINKSEYASYRQIYFAQPGDKKETKVQKRASRQAILDKLRGMSGAAAPPAPADSSDLSGYFR